MFTDPGRTSSLSHRSASVLSPLVSMSRTSALRSFRDSIARPSCSLCTLRAVIADDHATLAFRLVADLCRSAFSGGRFIQSISLLLSTSFDYELFTARRDVTLGLPHSSGTKEQALAFLATLPQCEEKKFKSVGLGDDYRYKAHHVAGTALIHDNCVVHTAFFSVEEAVSTAKMSDLRRRRAYRIVE